MVCESQNLPSSRIVNFYHPIDSPPGSVQTDHHIRGILAILNRSPGHKREFSLTDTTIQHSFAENERVPPMWVFRHHPFVFFDLRFYCKGSSQSSPSVSRWPYWCRSACSYPGTDGTYITQSLVGILRCFFALCNVSRRTLHVIHHGGCRHASR